GVAPGRREGIGGGLRAVAAAAVEDHRAVADLSVAEAVDRDVLRARDVAGLVLLVVADVEQGRAVRDQRRSVLRLDLRGHGRRMLATRGGGRPPSGPRRWRSTGRAAATRSA